MPEVAASVANLGDEVLADVAVIHAPDNVVAPIAALGRARARAPG